MHVINIFITAVQSFKCEFHKRLTLQNDERKAIRSQSVLFNKNVTRKKKTTGLTRLLKTFVSGLGFGISMYMSSV